MIIIIGLICGAVTLAIGRGKNIPTSEAFLWGALLGVIGIVVVLCSKTRAPMGMKAIQCPRCNAVQNVRTDQAEYECWQCKSVESLASKTHQCNRPNCHLPHAQGN